MLKLRDKTDSLSCNKGILTLLKSIVDKIEIASIYRQEEDCQLAIVDKAVRIWQVTLRDSSSDFMLISQSRKLYLRILTKVFFMKVDEEILIMMTFTSKE